MLYIIATPIGNLADISFRALETLKSVDIIFCEDTRQTSKLLDRYKIDKKMISLHQHSSEAKITKLLAQYKNIAYVSDAGTPGISDPGNKIVAKAVGLGIEVSPIPGASAVITALSVSGFPTDKFVFLGYMPHKGKTKIFEQIEKAKDTVCFYESTHRIIKTLEQLKEHVGERQICVCRELTKKFETIYRGTIDNVLDELKNTSTKGEFVVVINK